jgi:hypothetical protein
MFEDDPTELEKTVDLLEAVPYRLCDFTTEPTGYIESGVATAMQAGTSAFNYTCFSGFNATLSKVSEEVDEACVNPFSTTPQGVRACQGEPYHEDFFKKSPYQYKYSVVDYGLKIDGVLEYTHRHKVLFNLYAFDAIHSNLTHAPTLNLINCDFTYFMDKQALI